LHRPQNDYKFLIKENIYIKIIYPRCPFSPPFLQSQTNNSVSDSHQQNNTKEVIIYEIITTIDV